MSNDLIKRIEKIEQSLKTIENRQESMLSAVMEHLVNQSNLLKNYINTPVNNINTPIEGVKKSSCLISEEYKDLLKQEHINKWGMAASQQLDSITDFLSRYNIQDFVDYGCGSGNRLKTLLPDQLFDIQQYDPGVSQYNSTPEPSSGVVCVDVLEHVEPSCLENVLCHLQSLVKKAGYFSISTTPARRILQDGRNAHLIIESPDWWSWKLSTYFNIVQQKITDDTVIFEVTPLG
jgi:hypothetical protein